MPQTQRRKKDPRGIERGATGGYSGPNWGADQIYDDKALNASGNPRQDDIVRGKRLEELLKQASSKDEATRRKASAYGELVLGVASPSKLRAEVPIDQKIKALKIIETLGQFAGAAVNTLPEFIKNSPDEKYKKAAEAALKVVSKAVESQSERGKHASEEKDKDRLKLPPREIDPESRRFLDRLRDRRRKD